MNARFLFCLPWLMCGPLSAQEAAEADSLNVGISATASSFGVNDARLPGVSMAEGVAQITGVAVSPLLGVSVIGAWTWLKAEDFERDMLPWYCHPLAWGIGLSIIALCLMKDIFGVMVPAIAKKPLDWLELFENKASALLASTAFVPLVAIAMSRVGQMQREAVSGAEMLPLASTAGFAMHTSWFTIAVALIVFVVIWISSHAIHVLIAISPFGLVDALLKLMKLTILIVVVGSALIHPWLGLVVSLIFLSIAFLLVGWSMRLMFFGMLMGFDSILGRRVDIVEAQSGVKAFLARRVSTAPTRTFGTVVLDELGHPRFVWRSGFFGPKQSFPLQESNLVICKGLVTPSLSQLKGDSHCPHGLLVLLPRYRGLEADLAAHLGCQAVIENSVIRGLRAARQWFADVIGREKRGVRSGIR